MLLISAVQIDLGVAVSMSCVLSATMTALPNAQIQSDEISLQYCQPTSSSWVTDGD